LVKYIKIIKILYQLRQRCEIALHSSVILMQIMIQKLHYCNLFTCNINLTKAINKLMCNMIPMYFPFQNFMT